MDNNYIHRNEISPLDEQLTSTKIAHFLDPESLFMAEQAGVIDNFDFAAHWTRLNQAISFTGMNRSRAAESERDRVLRFHTCARVATEAAGSELSLRDDWNSNDANNSEAERRDWFIQFAKRGTGNGNDDTKKMIWQGFVKSVRAPNTRSYRSHVGNVNGRTLIVTAAQEEDILKKWPELKAYKDRLIYENYYLDIAFHEGENREEICKQFALPNVLKDVTLTVLSVFFETRKVVVEYTGTGLYGHYYFNDWGYLNEYWNPYPERAPSGCTDDDLTMVRFQPDHTRVFREFAVGEFMRNQSRWGDDISEYRRHKKRDEYGNILDLPPVID